MLPGAAIAQNDDDMLDDDDAVDDDDDATSFEDSFLDFTAPDGLEADTAYDFELTVFNMAPQTDSTEKVGEWIYAVDLTMPNPDGYAVDVENLGAPTPLHSGAAEGMYEISHWEANFDPNSATITWQAFGVVTSAEYGDIRENETLQFAFTATTDADATDGFGWTLFGDYGTDVQGVAYINDGTPDDDDTDDDDDAVASDDDDDSSGGCGC
jgi:hypothetical protein